MDWPIGFDRIPNEPWTELAIDELAMGYDTVEQHGWYSNLDYTVEQLERVLEAGSIVVDYSGGTGILADRLLQRVGDRDIGIIIVDSSPKFLRLALEKFRGDSRVAFRHVAYVKEERRLLKIDEVFEPVMMERGVDAFVSTNAVHLYYDLEDTLRSWSRVMRPGAPAFVQSGNIESSLRKESEWIIDATVDAIAEASVGIVQGDESLVELRPHLGNADYMAAHDKLRKKYFLPVRPLEYYQGALWEGGFEVDAVETRRVEARVDEWYEFLEVYHEGVLGWVGGAKRVTGAEASEESIQQRKSLMRRGMEKIFAGRPEFDCCWTYITARKPSS